MNWKESLNEKNDEKKKLEENYFISLVLIREKRQGKSDFSTSFCTLV